MNFLITNNINILKTDDLKDIKRLDLNGNNILLINNGIPFKVKYIDKKRIFIFGDLIIPAGFEEDNYLNEIFFNFSGNKIRDLCGFFYVIIEEENGILIFNSVFGILPLYYLYRDKFYVVSSDIEFIKKLSNIKLSVNYKYLIEKILFNYSFHNRTVYNQILLTDSNSYIELAENLKINKHLNINELYADNPVPWKKSLNDISDLFIERVKNYLPDSSYYSSFTGGFDGRTIVACGLYYKKDFNTFSYGVLNQSDVNIPSYIASKINIPYEPLIIDDNYSKELFLNYSKLFVKASSLTGSISRSHYAWMTDILKRKTNYIVSGNFGSEIIRTMKIPGVMTSELIFDYFSDIDNKLFENEISEYKKLKYFNADFIKVFLREIIDELIDYRNNYHTELNQNQRFYVYLFEEVFRKYFGPEIYYESINGLFNRSPFLDFEFVKELLKTGIAGVNSDYMEKNPLKRYKGQILYAHIINKTYPALGKFQSDKEYKPVHFLSPAGNVKIFTNYFMRVIWNQYILRKDKSYTSYNHRNILLNNEYFLKLLSRNDFYNSDYIKEKLTTSEDALFHILSCILYLNNK